MKARAIVAGVIVVALVGGVILILRIGTGSASSTTVVRLGKPAPTFSLRSLDGPQVDLASYRGKPVILNFWASWCDPCRRELPLLLLERGKHPGVELVGIVYQDADAPAKAFHDNIGGDWPGLSDPGGKVASEYLVRAIPETFFIDKGGVLRDRNFGEIDQGTLDQKLAMILI
jgi:cytochrome c biogenesis protein CcmG, thiol:disulfide interchange protein DsbE